MARRGLAAPERQHEERRQRTDAATDDGDGVEGCVIGPVNVLDDEDGRVRLRLELREEKRLHIVRRRAAAERLVERGRRIAREVSERPEGAWDREIVASAHEHASVAVEVTDEPLD